MKIFEGRDRVGGRIWDDQSLGTCVAKGAQIITGCINNPATLMCKQVGNLLDSSNLQTFNFQTFNSQTFKRLKKRKKFV